MVQSQARRSTFVAHLYPYKKSHNSGNCEENCRYDACYFRSVNAKGAVILNMRALTYPIYIIGTLEEYIMLHDNLSKIGANTGQACLQFK